MSKIVGYATGVFDLFHIGHLNVLERSKQNCDYLIVGVTTDKEVERVKKKRPIISQEERKAILEAIKYVDEVVYEDDTDKIKAWEELKFDRIFKGDDWKGSQLWNEYEKFFESKDVEVIYFPYTEGTSSTYLREVLDKFNKLD